MTEAIPTERPVIFVNYRRCDAGWTADYVASMLKRIFGDERVFLDVRGVDAGDEFAVVIEENLRRATVLIVLIGEGWLQAADKDGRPRLKRANDWVRKEIRTALERPVCRVIPLLIDDAKLPEKRELPRSIARLAGSQAIQIRQANSDDDIAALSRVLENAGFHRLPDSSQATTLEEFSDNLIRDTVLTLRKLQQKQASGIVNRRELIAELDRLFNRHTFRFEPLRQCPDQRWADRLDSAYQTEKALRLWERNVRAVAADKYRLYIDILGAVGSYCLQMSTLLFDPAVDYNQIRDHIGKTTFKAQLPPAIVFPRNPEKQPIIPDEVNNRIEEYRMRAVALMDAFGAE